VMPLMLYDPRTGKYHQFTEYKSGSEIPGHLEVFSLRIPASEEGRLWGRLLYDVMSNTSLLGIKDKAGRPGQNVITAIGNWLKDNVIPGINPVIKTGGAIYDMAALGENPEDKFRGQPMANPRMFDAGGMQRLQAGLGATLNQMGGPGEAMAALLRLAGMDRRAFDPSTYRSSDDIESLVQKFPVLKNMFSFDNYAEHRKEANEKLDDQRIRAQAKTLLGDEAGGIYDFYWRNLKRKDKLDQRDKARFDVAKQFVTQIWGDKTAEGSFYNRAAYVSSGEASKQAVETFKRDLATVSAQYVALYRLAGEMGEEQMEKERKKRKESTQGKAGLVELPGEMPGEVSAPKP